MENYVNRIVSAAALVLALGAPLAHATPVTAYTASHDVTCMDERGGVTSDVYERAKTMIKPEAVANLTERKHSAMANLVAFGDAHALEIRQGFEPRTTCLSAGEYAIGKMFGLPNLDDDDQITEMPILSPDDFNPQGSFYATLRPTEEATLQKGLTCANPYDFDIYLDKPKGKVLPIRDAYQHSLPSLRCH